MSATPSEGNFVPEYPDSYVNTPEDTSEIRRSKIQLHKKVTQSFVRDLIAYAIDKGLLNPEKDADIASIRRLINMDVRKLKQRILEGVDTDNNEQSLRELFVEDELSNALREKGQKRNLENIEDLIYALEDIIDSIRQKIDACVFVKKRWDQGDIIDVSESVYADALDFFGGAENVIKKLQTSVRLIVAETGKNVSLSAAKSSAPARRFVEKEVVSPVEPIQKEIVSIKKQEPVLEDVPEITEKELEEKPQPSQNVEEEEDTDQSVDLKEEGESSSSDPFQQLKSELKALGIESIDEQTEQDMVYYLAISMSKKGSKEGDMYYLAAKLVALREKTLKKKAEIGYPELTGASLVAYKKKIDKALKERDYEILSKRGPYGGFYTEKKSFEEGLEEVEDPSTLLCSAQGDKLEPGSTEEKEDFEAPGPEPDYEEEEEVEEDEPERLSEEDLKARRKQEEKERKLMKKREEEQTARENEILDACAGAYKQDHERITYVDALLEEYENNFEKKNVRSSFSSLAHKEWGDCMDRYADDKEAKKIMQMIPVQAVNIDEHLTDETERELWIEELEGANLRYWSIKKDGSMISAKRKTYPELIEEQKAQDGNGTHIPEQLLTQEDGESENEGVTVNPFSIEHRVAIQQYYEPVAPYPFRVLGYQVISHEGDNPSRRKVVVNEKGVKRTPKRKKENTQMHNVRVKIAIPDSLPEECTDMRMDRLMKEALGTLSICKKHELGVSKGNVFVTFEVEKEQKENYPYQESAFLKLYNFMMLLSEAKCEEMEHVSSFPVMEKLMNKLSTLTAFFDELPRGQRQYLLNLVTAWFSRLPSGMQMWIKPTVIAFFEKLNESNPVIPIYMNHLNKKDFLETLEHHRMDIEGVITSHVKGHKLCVGVMANIDEKELAGRTSLQTFYDRMQERNNTNVAVHINVFFENRDGSNAFVQERNLIIREITSIFSLKRDEIPLIIITPRVDPKKIALSMNAEDGEIPENTKEVDAILESLEDNPFVIKEEIEKGLKEAETDYIEIRPSRLLDRSDAENHNISIYRVWGRKGIHIIEIPVTFSSPGAKNRALQVSANIVNNIVSRLNLYSNTVRVNLFCEY